MAVQQGSQDLKIFSSVRPLQIQRSFEGPSEATDIVESVARDVTVEKRSSVTITSSQTSLTGMTTAVQSTVDGVPASPLSVAHGSVTINSASSTSSTSSPGTVLIRSSGAAPVTGTSPGVGSQNVVILRNPSVVAQTGPASQGVTGQGAIVIKSAASPPVTPSVVQPNAQSRIVINPAPIGQSRITITGGATPVHHTNPPQAAAAETGVAVDAPLVNPVPSPARRSSLTIKTAPSPTSPTPVTIPPPANTPSSIQPPQGAAVSDGPPEIHAPQEPAVTEVPSDHRPSTAAAVTAAKEDLSEKIHQKKPSGPSLDELLEKFDISKVFYTALAILVSVVVCILSEGEIPLSWLLAAISVISLGSFIALRL